MKLDKLVVSNYSALSKKYKKDLPAIIALLDKLVAEDKKRGLHSRVVYIDKPTLMKPLKAKAVSSATNRKQVKAAIDGLYKNLQPDYILLFGAPDIIPFQSLLNDNFVATMSNSDSDDDDDEKYVDSDLPYASDTPYGTRIKPFLNPSRVVSRIPDLMKKADTGFVAQLINNSIEWKPQAAFPSKIFALSTATWNEITAQILREALNSQVTPHKSPPRKEKTWKKKDLNKPLHLINCHGAPVDTRFYGEDAVTGEMEPASINSNDVQKNILKGTVVVAECCYGGELFPVSEKRMGISYRYLSNGAIGYVGSSCSSYGATNGAPFIYNADLVAKYFFRHLSNGASLGRAFLQARQEYISKNDQPDPTDMKTMAQFYLLGDPSLHLFLKKNTPVKPKNKVGKKSAGSPAFFTANRKGRREQLKVEAMILENQVSSLKKVISRVSAGLKTSIIQSLKNFRMPLKAKGKVFEVKLPAMVSRAGKARKLASDIQIKYHVYSSGKTIHKKDDVVIRRKKVLILRELNGEIINQKLVVSK